MYQKSRLQTTLRRLRAAPVLLVTTILFPSVPMTGISAGTGQAAGTCPGDIGNVTASSLSGESVPVADTGDWNVYYTIGNIAFSQRTKAGGGMVDESIGHEALNFTFKVDKHGYVSGKGKATYHFDVKVYSVAFPDQIGDHAYLVGGSQRRAFQVQGRSCPDGKIAVESTNTADLLLYDGAKQTSIGAWNVFPPEDAQIVEKDKRLSITASTYVKKIRMRMRWKASKCITFDLGEHRDSGGSTTTSETQANGPTSEIPITSTSIITYTNPNVVFKITPDDPYTHRMQQSVTGPLAGLAALVMKEWHDKQHPVKLRVTAAWGPPGTHGVQSFHYSGRALDLTTSDLDPRKYGCLAGLAYEAGFNWVFYENAQHVHASVS